MAWLRRYRMGFDPWALILFVAVMLPNILWAAIPAPNDVLRMESATPAMDGVGFAAQVIMVAALCMLISTEGHRPMRRGSRRSVIAATVCYAGGWAAYYMGCAHPAVLLVLTLAPCAAFLIFAWARRNALALAAGAVFTVCHTVFCTVNFLM